MGPVVNHISGNIEILNQRLHQGRTYGLAWHEACRQVPDWMLVLNQ
jgi:hypothetical protein